MSVPRPVPTPVQQQIAVLILTLIFVAIASLTFESAVDDAFISARYAEQIAVGHGVRYNLAGPPVEGVSNLAWVLWLAVAHLLNIPDHGWMVGSGLLFGALSIVLSHRLARAISSEPEHPGTLVAPAMLALSPHFAVATTNGLETAAFTASLLGLGVGAAWVRAPIPRVALGLAVAGLALLRPEGLPIGLVLTAALFARDGRVAWPTAFTWALGVALMTVWRWSKFGALLPNTGAAKLAKPWSEQWLSNAQYLSMDGLWWPIVALFAVWSCTGRRSRARWLLIATSAGLLLIASRVELWMPGARLLLPAYALVAVSLAARLVQVRASWSLVPAVGVVLAALLLGPRVRLYDEHHSVGEGNAVARALVALRPFLGEGTALTVRDAGVLAYYAGPQVQVFETHPRALTQQHPGGESVDLTTAPINPTLVVLTQARLSARQVRYNNDRTLFRGLSQPYRYLGRIYQHHHRYYDLYLRSDVGDFELPTDSVSNFDGPAAPSTQ